MSTFSIDICVSNSPLKGLTALTNN